MVETIDLPEDKRGKDKVIGISECTDRVIIHYERSGQKREIEVPRNYINFVEKLINGMEYGTQYHSKYIFNKGIVEFDIESNIIKSKIGLIQEILKKWNISKNTTEGIIKDLLNNNEFILMSYEEFIGIRKMDKSDYFRFYGAIKYWEAKEKISYNKRGYIMRIE